jgi:hypothetical protein
VLERCWTISSNPLFLGILFLTFRITLYVREVY